MLTNRSFLSRKIRIASAVLLSGVMCMLMLPSVSVYAQAPEKPQMKVAGCKNLPEKRKLKTIPQRFNKKVERIDELTNPLADKKGNIPEPNYKAAWPLMQKLISRCDECTKIEWANLYQRAAVIRFNLDDIPGAIKYFKKQLAQSPDIPLALETQLTYQVAQMLMSEEKYDEAIRMFNKWEAMCPKIVSEDYYYYRSLIHFNKGHKSRALQTINKLVDFKTNTLKEVPKEPWYRMQLSVYLDKENYKAAEKVAENLAVHYTKLSFVNQLSQLYGLNGKEKEQLALSEAARLAGGITSESQQKNIAYLYLSEEVPYLAARIMKEGLDKKKIARTSRNLEVYGGALAQAQEYNKSMPVMEEAASKADNGKLYAQLSGIYLNADKFKESIAAGKKALNKGGLRSVAEVHLFMGSAYMNQKRYTQAISALEKASKDQKYAKYSQSLIRYSISERKREADLAKTKADLAKES